MTIMTAGNSEGTRRCDGTCHNAKKPKCTCICGGRYHGKGQAAQEELTRDWLGENWQELKACVEAKGLDFAQTIVKAISGRKLYGVDRAAGEPVQHGLYLDERSS